MDVMLMAHTQLTQAFKDKVSQWGVTDGQAVALTAIRTCYSSNKPAELFEIEGEKYFGQVATDGGTGSEADRLIRHIVKSKHTSTLEHIDFHFVISGVSRSLLAQLTRHRVGFSFSVQSQRYTKFGSGDKSGGFKFVVPDSVKKNGIKIEVDGESTDALYFESKADLLFLESMAHAQKTYDKLRELGIPAEDARAVLPNAAACNLVMSANLTALLNFYSKRKPGSGAQHEISQFAERLKEEVVNVEPWTKPFFEGQ
ncbi:Prophage LambdaBa01, thymidylate synthase-complementing protein [Fictibacillus macauensis ZFHKF-1]|uniref:FAD-dependent thymidylate synthase n=1 Tax=Fictibacillus macauensis ZFHKF-1 TaxID=1196324 RepID=I8AK48_9BACL|nr:FAD-dependent thymidylate synthase [Fictibacillus macauensis]EIT85934.1 Prophage LambdaBa01, thymidylate synthase-complementing protein [Fictibacillus macauensis ZFHKF-1]